MAKDEPELRKLESNRNRPMVVHLRIRVAKTKQEELPKFLREAITYYAAPGGIRIRLLRNVDDPTKLIEVVEYEDQDAYEKDLLRLDGHAEMRAYLSRWYTLLEDDVQVETYEDLTDEIE